MSSARVFVAALFAAAATTFAGAPLIAHEADGLTTSARIASKNDSPTFNDGIAACAL